jgi:hypothetical protein
MQHNFELTQGEFLIGRSAECQLALDDPLVSRRHAVLIVTADSVTAKDLSSRNGVLVNGTRLEEPLKLTDGDRIMIGSQEMTLVAWKAAVADAAQLARRRTAAQTLSVMPSLRDRLAMDAAKEPTKRVESLGLLAALADKALALGRPDDAERILSSVLLGILRGTQEGKPLGPETLEQAGQYGVRLAATTGKGTWVDYVIALYTRARKPCPAAVVDELHVVIRKVPTIDLTALRAYLDVLREETESYGPADRFLVQRIEGLEKIAALR